MMSRRTTPPSTAGTSGTEFLDATVPPVLWAALGALLQRMFPSRPTSKGVRGLSVLLLVGSASLGLRAVRGFREHGTTVHPHRIRDVSFLVQDGAHSVSRNPMYTALLGALVSNALWRGRVAALIPVVAVWAALDKFQVGPEEAALADAFGAEFDRYRDAVPRWL